MEPGRWKVLVVLAFAFSTLSLLISPLSAGLVWLEARERGELAASAAIQAQQSHDAQCAVKEDLKNRVLLTLDYLRNHPDRIARFGITIAEAQNQLRNQAATVYALQSVIDCPGVDLPPLPNPLPGG